MENNIIDRYLISPPPTINHEEKNDEDGHDNHHAQYCEHVPNYIPGFRFQPTDEELIDFYLKRKVANQKLPAQMIIDVDLYKSNPEDLAAMYNPQGDNQWYFFTPREPKYPNGGRPNRAADGGYWKATVKEREVGEALGYRKVLVFYKGKAPRGSKTDWIMYEYRLNQPSKRRTSHDDMRLDDWVLCRIHKKPDRNPLKNGMRVVKNHHEQEHEGPVATNQQVEATNQQVDLVGNINAFSMLQEASLSEIKYEDYNSISGNQALEPLEMDQSSTYLNVETILNSFATH